MKEFNEYRVKKNFLNLATPTDVEDAEEIENGNGNGKKPSWLVQDAINRSLDEKKEKNNDIEMQSTDSIRSLTSERSRGSNNQYNTNNNNNSVIDPNSQPDSERSRMILLLLLLKIMYAIVSVIIFITAALSFTTNIQNVFLAIYTIFFSILLCSVSCAPGGMKKRLISCFGGLYYGIGRLIFTALLSFLLLHFGILGIISLVLLGVTSIAHICLDCIYRPYFSMEFRKVSS